MSYKPKVKSALQACCPQCRKGKMFVHSAYHPKFSKMHTNCPKCGLLYERETGFFWGAMYISYAFSVAIVVPIFLFAYYVLNNPSAWVYVGMMVTALILFTPLSFRYSRVLMLYLFGNVDFRPDLSKD